MPFPMTHLVVAREIIKLSPNIQYPEDFYMGALAPDSVHFRGNFTDEYKKVSHICRPSWLWGKTVEGEVWKQDILAYFRGHERDADNHDFLCGYICHLLLDNAWYVEHWRPFCEKYPEETEKLRENPSHKECYDLDTHYYERLAGEGIVLKAIGEAVPKELPGLMVRDELSRMIDSLRDEQYRDRPLVDTSRFVYISEDWANLFIMRQAREISGILFK